MFYLLVVRFRFFFFRLFVFFFFISANAIFPKAVQCEIEGANLHKYISLGVVAYPGSWGSVVLRVCLGAYVR